ncbi:MAG: CDP-diacylglycerol--glycerol-3-phosphate 3-phosphatidyltransferase [Oscillospiraceae bacterium]
MNIPNTLSLFRLVLVPVFGVTFFGDSPAARYYAAAIYALAFLTDIADGWIARHFNQVTKLGRILDPLADKLMTFTVIICITVKGIVPLWAVVIFFGKEIIMGLGALVLYRRTDDVIPANIWGKISTGFFFVVCAALVLFPQIPSVWANGLMAAALALTIFALLRYLMIYLKMGKKQKDS